MAKKRKECFVDRREITKLTKMANAWEFTCSFNFASRSFLRLKLWAATKTRTGLEEQRLYVKDPIGYRKRAYILSMKEASGRGDPNPNPNPNPNHRPVYLHADKPVVKFEVNAAGIDYNSYICRALVLVMNFLPPKEVSLVERIEEENGEGKPCMEMDHVDGYGFMDLSLKL